MKFSELQRLQRMEGITVLSADERIEQLEARLHTVTKERDALRAIPGAQPEPSEQDASVRKAWARFSHELHRSPDAPYPGMADAFEQHFSQSFIDREWRAEAATWAAAWKAAKRHCAQPAPSVQDVPAKSLKPVIDWLRNGCDPMKAADELELLIAAAAPEAKP